MGRKGDKLSGNAAAAAERLVERLSGLGAATSRKMFGGFGIFESDTMFGIVDSAGRIFLRSGDGNAERFEEAGSERHGRMPYHSVPTAVLDDDEALVDWAEAALAVARAAKGKK